MSVNHNIAQVIMVFEYANKKLLKQFNMHCRDIFTWTTLAHFFGGGFKTQTLFETHWYKLQHVNTVKMNT